MVWSFSGKHEICIIGLSRYMAKIKYDFCREEQSLGIRRLKHGCY